VKASASSASAWSAISNFTDSVAGSRHQQRPNEPARDVLARGAANADPRSGFDILVRVRSIIVLVFSTGPRFESC
jgi:hypothetical protein